MEVNQTTCEDYARGNQAWRQVKRLIYILWYASLFERWLRQGLSALSATQSPGARCNVS